MLTDSHAHLEAVADLGTALARAKDAGVSKIITIGTSLESSKKAVEIAETLSAVEIFAAVGLHPGDSREDLEHKSVDERIESLSRLARSSRKVIGIGECGLDYATAEGTEGRSETTEEEKIFQRELFEAQIKLADELDLPVVVHCRNGWEEIFDLISDYQSNSHSSSSPVIPAKAGIRINADKNQILDQVENDSSRLRGVFHTFTGGVNEAKKAIDLGFYVSFSGIVTFKNALPIQEAARLIPTDKILIETDSPYLAPEPFRGKTNEPSRVTIIGQFLAQLRGVSFDKIAEATTKNAEALFGF